MRQDALGLASPLDDVADGAKLIRCIPEVATNKVWSDQSEGQARRRDPLCALALRGTEAHFDEGCIELDNSPVERTIRPITLNRKNALFADSVAAPSTALSSLR